MKNNILIIILFSIILLAIPSFSGSTTDVSVRYAEVTIPRVSIRKEIEPKSEVVLIAKEGQSFEIVSSGNLWLEVKTENGNGWLPVTSCRIIDRKKTSLLSSPGHTIAFVGIILIGISFVIIMISRNRDEEEDF